MLWVFDMEHIQGQYTYIMFSYLVWVIESCHFFASPACVMQPTNVNLMQNPIKFKYLMKQNHDLNIVFTILFSLFI